MSSARLYCYSQAVPAMFDDEEIDQDMSTLDGLIVYAARVSNPASQAEGRDPARLIDYLTRNKHWSPFEMVSATIEITTTRDIARQILRHRSFSFQEFSQRYADLMETGFDQFIPKEARLQDDKNRQSSHEVDDDQLQVEWRAMQEAVYRKSMDAYAWARERHIAKEVARVVLPEGNTQSRLYMAGTMRSWIHYVDLRTKPGTQKEHRQVTLDCVEELSTVFPMIRSFVHEQDK